MAMRKTGYITILLTGFLATLLLGSCSTDDVAELPLEEGVPVRFENKAGWDHESCAGRCSSFCQQDIDSAFSENG